MSKLLPLLALGLGAAASAPAQQLYPQFLIPSFDGQPNSEYSNWDLFYAANNGVENYPDIAAPNGTYQTRTAAGFPANPGYALPDPGAFWNVNNPTIAQTTNGAFIVGAGAPNSGNIYSFSTATQFVLQDTTPYVANTVVFQFQSAGSLVDYANIRLTYVSGGTTISLSPNDLIKEFKGSGSEFGGVESHSAMQWDLTGLNVTSYQITFGAEEASLSFQRALLDTSNSTTTVVPISRIWDAGAGASVNWSNATNWSANIAPLAGANVTFSAGSSATLDSAQQVGEVRFAAAGGFTLGASGGAKLTVNTGIGASGAATYTINAPIVMGGLHYDIIGDGSTVILNGTLEAGTYADNSSVVGGFVKEGLGTLIINGNIGTMGGSVLVADGTLRLAGTNSYSGLTAVQGGTLVIASNSPLSSAGALGTNSAAVQVGTATGSTNYIPPEARVVIDGAFTVGKNFTVVGGNDLASFGGRNTGTGATFGGNIGLSIGDSAKNAALFAEATSDIVNFNGTISGGNAARTLTKTGAGTVVFGGLQKTYLNASVVQSGTLEIATGSSTAGNGNWQVASGARFRVNGTLGGTGALTLNGGTLTGSGTVNKALTLDAGDRVAPGVNVGTLTLAGAQSWTTGGGYEWQIASAAGASGTGFDFLQITGALDVGSSFNLYVTSVTLAGLAAPLGDFNIGQTYQWLLATASGGITGFDPSDFVIDASGFANAPNGLFSVTQNGNSLYLNYAPVPEPGVCALLALGGALGWVARRRTRRR